MISLNSKNLLEKIDNAEGLGLLLPESCETLREWISAEFLPSWATESLEELVEGASWEELNDRFFKSLEFGTGGMRGRTIGRKVTSLEQRPDAAKGECPLHAGVGASMMNDFNVVRATIGLYRYCEEYLKAQGGGDKRPRLVIAHDVRHFSKHFSMLTASTWNKLGGEAMVFAGPRSTPQLSFSVRYLHATAGVVVTASHNPPHDNGYKVYFEDGGQVVDPHAEGIIARVEEVELGEIANYLEIESEDVIIMGEREDDAYFRMLESGILDPDLIRSQKPKVVFTPIHGTGGVMSVPLMEKAGVDCFPLEIQMKADPNFSTVASPNPENAEALELALEKGREIGADIIIGTDPDADRMAVGVRSKNDDFVLFSGNQIGAILAEYRLSKLKDYGWLPKAGTQNAAIIKTFVTTQLIDAIGKAHGVKVINTLTGFKWIGSKIKDYEDLLLKRVKNIDYDSLEDLDRAQLLVKHSTFFVFGGEESYGFLSSDRVRDKDANATTILFCELAAHLKKLNLSFEDYLNALYVKHGYYTESLLNLSYTGATGFNKIRGILKSYRDDPPSVIDGVEVENVIDFSKDELFDADGKRIPEQDFFIFELKNGYRCAVRGSGTEPKIKFYLFAYEAISGINDLEAVKSRVALRISSLKQELEKDAKARGDQY